jgi:hypothetical protein
MRKGSHHTEESRLKMRESDRGKHLGKSSGMKGKHHSQAVKDKMRKKMLGRKDTLETRKRKSESRRGDKTYNYKGIGWNATLHPYLDPYEYRDLRKRVKARDGSKCQQRGRGVAHSKMLSVHHIVPSEVGHRFVLCDNESNMITLCQSCHVKIHGGGYNNPDAWKGYLPEAKKYLSKFGYEKMLLDKYINQ